MNNLRLVITAIFFTLGQNSSAQLLNETFDSDTGFAITDGNVASATFFSDDASDYFGIIDIAADGDNFGSGSEPSGSEAYTGFDNFYLINEDMDGDGPVLPYTLTWSSISLSGETFLEISADFASTQADSNDYIVVSYRLDGGTWTPILGVGGQVGLNNSDVYEITDFSGTTGDSSATALSIASTNISNTFSLSGTESTLEIRAEFSNDNGTDNFAMDNLVVQVSTPPSGPQAPTVLSAIPDTAPNNKDQIVLTFTPDSSNDTLVVYNIEDSFGAPVDSTTYTPGDLIPGGGIVAGVFSSSPATITGLAPGTTYYIVAFSVDGSTTYSNSTSSVSATTSTFALQTADNFDDWTAVDVAGDDSWFVSGTFASCNGFGGTNPEEDWLISPEIDLDSFEDETFEFDYRSNFEDPNAVGLELFYTTNYTGDPTTTTWLPFTTTNAEFDANKSTGSQTPYTSTSVDLSTISGNTVRLGFKYITGGVEDDGRDWDLQNPLVIGNASSDSSITLSATPMSVNEGATLVVTLTLPSNASGDTEIFLSSNDDGSELTFPASVTVLDATNSIDFNVNGQTDNLFDTDQIVALTANATGFTLDTIDITVVDVDIPAVSGDLIISQYYEGSSNNKYIEITNVGASPIDLTGYIIARWGNARAEEYKTATSAPVDDYDTLDLTPLGTLDPNQTVVLANSSAASPIPAASTALTQGFPGALTFNGNDSIVIYNSTTPDPSNIVDAIGFTNSGNEGANTSFVRAGAFQGYDLSAGSNATSTQFASIWTEVTNSIVDEASFGEDEFLGTTALATVPTIVGFSEISIAVAEDGVSADLTLEISNPDGSNSVSIDVVFNSASSTADTSDIAGYTTQTVVFPANSLSGDQQTVTVTITDDNDAEGNENALFDLSNLISNNASAEISSADTITLTIQDDDIVIPAVFISEIADPNDNGGDGRFVELYNASDATVDLSAGNWNLITYFNANSSGSELALTGTIPAGGTYVIAQDATNFDAVYGLAEDQGGGPSSNGDDNFELRFGGGQSTGTLVDIYGTPGTQAQNSDDRWFQDGRAVRNAEITSGNTTFNVSEWTINSDADTNPNGVANVEDMTPGIHPDGSGPVLPTYPITEDFSGISTWVNQTVAGSFPWVIDNADERAEADGFADGPSTENHYLVSPAFDFTGVSDVTIAFDYGEAFDGPDLELLYSTNYSGSGDPEAVGVIWTTVNFTFTDTSADENFSSSSSGDIALPALLEGQTGVYFAFKYTADGTDTGSEQWFIDNIVVDALSASDPLGDYLAARSLTAGDLETDINDNGFTVIEEYLAGFGDGSGPDFIRYSIDSDGTLALTLTSDLENEPDGITVILLATSDLTVDFASVEFTTSVIDNGDGTFTRSYTETTPPSDPERFLRLDITADSSN
ncbi:MAG: lamin tail domain-containing protein [Verrucomicrobiota bacterium]